MSKYWQVTETRVCS